MEAIGFWSYVHADDEAEHGRILELAHDIVDQMQMISAEAIHLFTDRGSLEWGARWRRVVDEGLSSVAFFIPVITPRYFRSSECRRELQSFARQASSLGIESLVLPIIYIDVPTLSDPIPDDNLVTLIKEFQWEVWTSLRFASRDSSEYRIAVARLAQRLVDANQAAEESDIAVSTASSGGVVLSVRDEIGLQDASGPSGSAEDEPGTLDLIAGAETAMPRLTASTTSIGVYVETIGSLFTQSTVELEQSDARGAGIAGRLFVARSLASKLSGPVADLHHACNEFATQLHTVDLGIRALIENIIVEARSHPEARQDACEFFDTLLTFQQNVRLGLDAAESMGRSVESIENYSRDLRVPLRSLRAALILFTEGRDVVDDWMRIVDESGITC